MKRSIQFSLALFCCCAWAIARPAQAQQRFTISGEVVERGTRAPIAGVTVVIAGLAPVLTNERGGFRITNVPAGPRVLLVRGLGYAVAELPVTLQADTSIVIDLERTPVALDTVRAAATNVTIRGVVRDESLGAGLLRADVSATQGRTTKTDALGRFRFDKVPAAVPLTLSVQSFGYLPVVVTFQPRADTTVTFLLEPDSVALRMLADKMKLVDERSAGQRYKGLPTLERAELMRLREKGRFLDVLQTRLGSSVWSRVVCIVVDENPIYRWRLQTLLPAEVQRVEVAEYVGMRRALMVRVYTREFAQQLVSGRGQLVPAEQAMNRAGGLCR